MKWSIKQRKERLDALYHVVERRRDEICAALYADLHKNEAEGYMTEVGIVLREIRLMRKNMKRWLKPRRVRMPLFTFPSRGYILREPYGRVLVIAPWNYPFQLTMVPLVGAVAAGNSVTVKASPYGSATEKVVGEILEEVFEQHQAKMERGGAQRVSELLEEQWDYIFFTGSSATGRIVARAAAEHLTPVTLELGGKSPCIISETTDLRIAARRVAWGKFLNAGQTCVAPDYLFVQQSVAGKFETLLGEAITEMFSDTPELSPLYGRIVNVQAFDRLTALYPEVKHIREELYIAPTVVKIDGGSHPLMEQEIFGPILPIMTYDNIEEPITYINGGAKPLALYYFGENKAQMREVVERCDSGGVCINDTVMHLSSSSLPFGGVGASGMGAYHGQFSISTFTHPRTLLRSTTAIDVKTRYNPLSNLAVIKKIIK